MPLETHNRSAGVVGVMAKARSVVRGVGCVALAAVALGCDGASPTAPSESREPVAGGHAAAPLGEVGGQGEVLAIASAPDGSTMKSGAPTAQSPINDQVIGESLMPTLTAVNTAGTFVTSAFDYRFEVHTRDGGSGLVGTLGVNAVLTHSGIVGEGGDGTTRYTVPSALEEGTAYQWRARAEKTGRYGPWSAWAYFSTPVLASIDVPILNAPVNGSTVTSVRPVLEVVNGESTGNVGTVSYEFQLSRNSSFTDIVETLTQTAGQHPQTLGLGASVLPAHLAEQRTSVLPSEDLDTSTTYFWRAQGTNEAVATIAAGAPPGVVSGFTGAWSFTTPAAAPPPGSGGSGDQFNLNTATFLHHNVTAWPITSTVTSVSIGNPPICIKHTKAGGWPVITVSGTAVEGNAWVVFQLGGTWFSATWEFLRPGQTCKELKGSDLGPHIKVPPGNTWSPKSGEKVCFFVSTPARNGPQGPLNERSNVFCITWP